MTTSKELSEKLYEAGLRIETEKWHICIQDVTNGVQDTWIVSPNYSSNPGWQKQYRNPVIPAYSTDELLAVMPFAIKEPLISVREQLVITKIIDVYFVFYNPLMGEEIRAKYKDSSLPEALGKMCLWLLENGHLPRRDKG